METGKVLKLVPLRSPFRLPKAISIHFAPTAVPPQNQNGRGRCFGQRQSLNKLLELPSVRDVMSFSGNGL